MSMKRRGASALDRLKSRYDREARVCPECGYEDEPGSWRVETTGSRVYYRHLCPSCGSRSTRVLRLTGSGGADDTGDTGDAQ